jgi:hypothetical protein
MAGWKLFTASGHGEGYTTHTSLKAAVAQAHHTSWQDGAVLRIECPDGTIISKSEIDRLKQS